LEPETEIMIEAMTTEEWAWIQEIRLRWPNRRWEAQDGLGAGMIPELYLKGYIHARERNLSA
jgi:hypothetical protein